MDIDAVGLDPADPMTVIRRICWERKLCFYCLKTFNASHRDSITKKCPNVKATSADCLALLQSTAVVPSQQVAAIKEEDFFDGLDAGDQLQVQALVSRYWENVHTLPASSYPAPSDLVDAPPVNLASVCVSGDKDSSRFTITGFIPGTQVAFRALLDTGAQGCFVDKAFATAHHLSLSEKLRPVTCVSFDGSPGVGGLITKEWTGDLRFGSHDLLFPVLLGVTNLGHHQMILGLPWLDSVGAVLRCGPGGWFLEVDGLLVAVLDLENHRNEVSCESLSPPSSLASPLPVIVPPGIGLTHTPLHFSLPPEFEAYKSVFLPQELLLPPHRPFDCAIKLKPGAVAPFGGLYTLTPDEKSELRDYLDDQLARGHIVPSSSAAAGPIFFVKVPGKKNRPVVDYRALNKVTIRDSYPIPVVGWLLNQLIGCKFFAKIDLKAAFNLLRVASGDEWLTAFRTPWGLFEYRVMPFGLANAPAVFQRFIQSVLCEYLDVFCFVYLDDILIFLKTRSDHVNHVSLVLSKLKEHHLTASPEKCLFFADRVIFLGFVITPTGLSMDPAKVATISDWPYPRTAPDLLRFLGFANFYRRFISHFSHIVSPLTALTKNSVSTVSALLQDTPRHAFLVLKRLFSSTPFLLHFDFSKPRVLQVDCLGVALSGILSQTGDDNLLRPVAYFSRKLSPAEQRWQVHDQELGAIVSCFTEWRCWLSGTNSPVAVLSDHANLRYFMSSKQLTPRQARWASFLSMFSFEILHTPGKLNPADPASRRPDYVMGKEPGERVVLLGHRALSDNHSDSVLSLCSITSGSPADGLIFDPSFMPADDFTLHCLRTLYDLDELIRLRRPSVLRFEGGLWWWLDRLYVPAAFRVYLIGKMHGDPVSGHWGVFQTSDLLSRTFSWPNLRANVLRFTSSCVQCQQINVNHQRPQGELMPLPIPDCPWSQIGVDFIVKLPTSDGWDSIMVVVDHFSKTAHFIPARETWDAAKVATAFVSSVFRLHGLPDRIVSDRGSSFMSRFWKEVQRLLCISPAPSTAFHPATDGQVERVNAILEDFLRKFVNIRQDDWVLWLPIAELSYNNTPSSSTSTSPFFACHGFHPRFNSLTVSSTVPRADLWIR